MVKEVGLNERYSRQALSDGVSWRVRKIWFATHSPSPQEGELGLTLLLLTSWHCRAQALRP
jgi:hypothetical protein